MAKYKSEEARKRSASVGITPIPAAPREYRDDIGRFQDNYRDTLEEAAAVDSGWLNLGVGVGMGGVIGFGGLASIVGSGSVDPMNLGFKIANTILSRKPSDLVTAHALEDSPSFKEIQAMKVEFDEAFRDSNAAKFGAFVGEWVPAFFGMGAAAGLGRMMTMRLTPALLKSAGKRKLLNSFSTKTAEALTRAGDDMASNIARRGTDVVGGIPMFERTMMAVGNSMGFGTFEAVRTLGKTGKPEVALKEAAVMIPLGVGLEMGLVGAGRALFPSFRTGAVDTAKAWKKWKELNPKLQDEILAGDIDALAMRDGNLAIVQKGVKGESYLTEGEKAINELVNLEIAESIPGLSKAITLTGGDIAPREAKVMLQKYLQNYKSADIDGIVKDMRAVATVKSPRSGGVNFPDEAALKKEVKVRVDAINKAEKHLRHSVANLNALDESMISPNLRRMLDDTPVSAAQRLDELGHKSNVYARLARRQANSGKFVAPAVRLKQLDLETRKFMFSVYGDVLEGFRLKWAESPGSLGKRLGVSGIKVVELTELAENEIKAIRSKIFHSLNGASTEIARLGRGNKKLPHHVDGSVMTEKNRHWVPVRDAYEDGGLDAVRRDFGDGIASVWDEHVVQNLEYFGQQLKNLGINSMMSDVELGMLGTKAYFPHVMRRTADWKQAEKQIIKALTRQGKSVTEARQIIASGDWKRTGLRKWGTIDQQRKMTGTTRQKSDMGIPLEEDPLVALRDHLDASVVREAMGKRFGPNGEMGDFYKAAIIAEGGSETAAHQLLDTILFESASNQAAAKLSRMITSSQIVTKLAWAVIPNAFQTTITAIRFGPKAALKGTKAGIQDAISNFRMLKHFQSSLASADKETIAASLGLMERSILAGKTIFEGNHPSSFPEEVAELFLKWTGFTMTERMNRVIAAHSGLAHTRDIIQKMAAGKLKGSNWVNSRRSLDSLGIDVEKILKRYKATGNLGLNPEEINQVITQSVKQTQFSTGILDVPPGWRTPMGKVLFQFKTFAFSAGKTMRDQVWREFDQGNYKPFLYFMTIGSVSGEAIGAVTSLAKGRPRDTPNGPMRIVEDISNFGGFGIAKNIADAAMYGQIAEMILGPAASTLIGGIQNAAQKGPLDALVAGAKREPTIQVAGRLLEASAAGAALLTGSVGSLTGGWDFTPEEEEKVERKYKSTSGFDAFREEVGRLK